MQRTIEYSEIIKEIPGLKQTNKTEERRNAVSCGWIYNDNKEYQDTNNTSCHASFKNINSPEKPNYAWNGIHDPKDHKEYIKWITDETISPWKTILSDSILITENGIIDSILIDSKHNGYITCNLFIAIRIATEHNEGEKWKTFINGGIQPDLACLLTTYLDETGNKWVYFDRGSWHKPFNESRISLKRFLSHNPIDNGNCSIKEGTYNNICNNVWEKGCFKEDIEFFLKDEKEIKIKSKYGEIIQNKQFKSFKHIREFQTFLLNKYKG